MIDKYLDLPRELKKSMEHESANNTNCNNDNNNNFAVPGDHRVKIKESKKINKYLDLTRE